MRAHAPPVQHLLRGGYKHGLHAFQGGQRRHGRFGTPEEEKRGGAAGGSNCRRVNPRDASLGHALRWRCEGGLAITRAAEEDDGGDRSCVRAFDLIVSEAKTEIMCLRAKGMPESTATFGVEAAGQVYNQTN